MPLQATAARLPQPQTTRAAIGPLPAQLLPYRPATQDAQRVMRWMRRRKLVKRRQAVERHAPVAPAICWTSAVDRHLHGRDAPAGWRDRRRMVRGAGIPARLLRAEGDLLEVGLLQSFDAITCSTCWNTFELRALHRAEGCCGPAIAALTTN